MHIFDFFQEANVASKNHRTIPCPECRKRQPENMVEIFVPDDKLEQEGVASVQKIKLQRLYDLLDMGLAEADVCPECGSDYDRDEEGRILV